MCTNLNTTFAWIGAILVNIGFLALISWGGSTLWPLGFLLCGLYTVCLYSLATWLQKRELENQYQIIGETTTTTTTTAAAAGTSDGDDVEGVRTRSSRQNAATIATSTSGRPKVSVSVNLLYGLAVISFAGTGLFLPLNLIDNCYGTYQPDHRHGGSTYYKWTTNVTSLPPKVRRWATQVDPTYSNYPSFAYVATTKTTLFRGTDESIENPNADECLWTVDSMNPPVANEEYLSPTNFHGVTNSTVCFTSTTKANSLSRPNDRWVEKIFCTDERSTTNIRPALKTPPLYDSGSVGNFKVDNGTLWFMQFYEESGQGVLIYSLDPTSMETTLYSERKEIDNGDDHHDRKHCIERIRLQAFFILLVSVLPATLVSIVAWYTQQIPSMAVTTFGGLYATFLMFYVMVAGGTDDDSFETWNESWLCGTGLLWLIVLTYLSLDRSITRTQRIPMKWGLVVSGLGFFVGVSGLLHDAMNEDTFGFWVVWNLVAFAPLLLLGMVTNSMFLVFFGGLGFLVDAVRFSSFVSDKVSGDAQGPVGFLVFAIAGLAAGAFGYKLTQYQPFVEDAAQKAQEYIHSCFSRPNEVELMEGGTDSLLGASRNEDAANQPQELL